MKKDGKKRVWFLLIFCTAVFAAFLVRLYWMQFTMADHYAKKLEQASQTSYTVRIPAARGSIVDRSGTALVLAAVLYSVVFGATDALVGIFNSENSVRMAQFAHMGMRLYFIGYFFAGFNIVAAGYLSATDRPAEASITSICRGMAAIVVCSLVLSRLFGMNGVWAAFPASELLTALLTLFLLLRRTKTE